MSRQHPVRARVREPGQPVVCVLGLGQMGLVCASMLADPERKALGRPAGQRPQVVLWGHSPEEGAQVAQTRQSDRLPGLRLPDEVQISLRIDDALRDADIVVSAIPVQYSRGVWGLVKPHLAAGAAVVSVSKGIENGTLMRPTVMAREVLGSAVPAAALSGPTIATELARCLPATMVAASEDAALSSRVQELFTMRWMRVYSSEDLVGVELAGAMKNVIAIAAGILDGLQAGNNAKSALLARGLAEIARLGVAMGAKPETFFGIAGAGDLATSCFSPEGRNRSCGEALGRGQQLEEYLEQTTSVVEGVATTRSVMDLAARYKVEMPITAGVHGVLFEGVDPIEALTRLLCRSMKAERVG